MDELRERVRDDLRGQVRGDLFFEAVDRAVYACDGSLYELDPLGVVVPRSVEDVAATIRYAGERGISLHARGAGTGLAGESLGKGLVIDFSRYLRRLVAVRGDRVIVQPGAVLDDVNAQLALHGRKLGPDPSESSTCTIGGMIGGDSSGSRSLKYGTMADAVDSLDVLYASGERDTLQREPWPNSLREPQCFRERLVGRLTGLLSKHAELITSKRPQSKRNRAGYALDRIASADGVNLARLICGSEGTLAIVVEATLWTVPLSRGQAVVLLPFEGSTNAARSLEACLEAEPAACEMLDWRRLTLAREADPSIRSWVNEATESALIVEFEGDDPAACGRKAQALANRLDGLRVLSGQAIVSSKKADCDLLLNVRKLVTPQVLRSAGLARPVPVVEDAAVAPERLEEVLQQVGSICRELRVNWTFHAHAGHGQLHIRPFLDLGEAHDLEKLEPLATAIHDVVLAAGGTISGEHGCGLVRTPFLRKQYGELVEVFREVKEAFDPGYLLNPGKIVEVEQHQFLEDLKPRAPRSELGLPTQGLLPVLNQPLRWLESSRMEEVDACNGCGDCRSCEPSLRMCPTFRGMRLEAASPRAQVNLLRQVASGQLDPRLWGSDELRNHANLCVHCRLCRLECPAGIDVSGLMLEAKAASVENLGLTMTEWATSRMDVWARWASRLPILSQVLLTNGMSRWWIERVFGLSRHRVVPRPYRWPYVGRAERAGLTRPRPHDPGPRVAYFVDIFANYFDQELAESVVAVLHHAGVNVFVPKSQRGCGMPSLVVGDLDRAREMLISNLRILSNAVRDGYTVVCSEPTATMMLRDLSLTLTDDLDAELVSRNTMDVGSYLQGLAQRNQLPPPVESLHAKVGYHQPCHLRALEVGTPGLDLIRAIPGLDVEFVDRGCSGIAGVYGLSKRNFRNSLRAGRGLRSRMKDPDIEIGSTECGTCRMQMEQGLTKRTLHPMKLLSMAYGLNPGLRRNFKSPKPRHQIS